MTTIKRCTTMTAAAAMLLTMLGAGAGCESVESQVTWQLDGTPRHEHPYQDWWHYQVVYPPDARTYFDPYRRTYFWFENGTWRSGGELPPEVQPENGRARVVRIMNPLPFVQHETMVAMHPPRKDTVDGFLPPNISSYADISDMPVMMAGESTDGEQP